MKFMTGLIFFLLFTNISIAETYQYLLKGSYKLDSSHKTAVEYTLKWSEENGRIRGVYADNLFAKSAEVSGVGNDVGRTFVVRFPEEKNGVISLTILSALVQDKATATALPVSIVTRDKLGNPLTTVKASSDFSTTSYSTVAQLQEENRCTEGFGVLSGYCGLYAGLLSEEQDRRNKCNLLFSDAVRLELSPDTTVMLHLGEPNQVISTPGHAIGRIPLNPQKSGIDILNRICGPLSGVNSSSENCKLINLKGDFSTVGETKHFSGTYTITEEGTNNVCRYGLSMDMTE